MRPKERALGATAIADQGKLTQGKSRDELRAKKLKDSRLSMIQRHVTPRGLRINAGRAFA